GEPVDLPGRGRPAGGEHAAEGGAAEHGLAPGPGEGVGGDDPAAGRPERVPSGGAELGGRGGGQPADGLAGGVDRSGGPGRGGAGGSAGVAGVVQPTPAVKAPRLRPSSQTDLAQSGERRRIRNNIAVIRLLRLLEDEKRPARAP